MKKTIIKNRLTLSYEILINVINDNHISIRRIDGQPFNPTWKELQLIKNKYFGTEAYAIEIFPADEDVVDNNNHRHIWKVDKTIIPNLR
jgi:hypothetical protein